MTQPVPAAAVAAVLRQSDSGSEALLIRRSTHAQDPWSGHMALPGGMHHADDATLLDTALRETLEEVGLDLRSSATLLGALEPLPAMARGRAVGFTVTPFVFLLHRPWELRLDPNEVQEVLWAPLDALGRGEHHTEHAYSHDQVRMRLPAFDVQGRVVWGLTHRMLTALLALGAPASP